MKGRRLLRQLIFIVICGLFLAAVGSTMAWAQIAVGSVTGTVQDSTGAVIPNAAVTLTNVDTAVVQSVQSTNTGSYTFAAVMPGNYVLKVTAPGFQDYSVRDIRVHVQQISTVNAVLSVGKAAQQVVVTASVPLLQAQSASIGQTIGTTAINDLPLVNRNWVSLAQLSAGVATAPPNTPSTDSGTTGSAYFSVNGINLWQNDIRLNGIDDNIEIYGGSAVGTQAAITPPPDAVQEFTLQTGDFNAEFGHSTGSVVNAVLKSGTNHFHGNVWEYVRNDAFNANDYFSNQHGTAKPEYRQNEFGGTFGGPIFKDKTFFFGDYQGERVVIPVQYTSTVPTPSMVSSNFTNLSDLITYNSGTATDALGRIFAHGTIFDPATTRAVAAHAMDPISGLTNSSSSTVYVRDPYFSGNLNGMTDFTGMASQLNQLPGNRMDPYALKILSLYPARNGAGLSSNFLINDKEPETTNQYDIRIDQNFSQKNILFGAFDRTYMTNTVPSRLPGLAVGNSGGRYDTFPAYAISVGYTHVFSPSFTNELHFGMDHSDKNQKSFYGNDFGLPEQYGIAGIPQIAENGGLPAIGVQGFTGIGVATYSPTLQAVYDIEIADNVAKNLGNHQFKIGYQIDYLRGNIAQPPYGRGSFSYTGNFSDIPNKNTNLVGIGDFLIVPQKSTVGGIDYLGGLQSYIGSNFATNNDRRYYHGAYFQDDWKITHELTLNLGVRWDYFTPYVEVNGRQANMVQDDGGDGPTGTLYMPNKGCAVARSAAFDSLLAASGIKLDCVSNMALGSAQKTNFAPRVGFAYLLRPGLVVRSGYGIAYGALGNIGFGGNLGNAYPFLYTINASSTSSQVPLLLPNGQNATMENTFANINISDPTLASGQNLSLYGRQLNFQTPYTQTYNLTVQYQFTRRDSLQAGYVGTVGRHLDDLTTHNSVSELLPPGTSQTPYLPLPHFTQNSTYERTNGVSSYNSLQVTYQRNMGTGMMLLANYTYSKCMSNQRTQSSASPGYRAQWLPGFGIGPDYTTCDTDTTNVVHFSGTDALPFGRGRAYFNNVNGVANAIIGGWNVNYIYSFQSGEPFNIGCATATSSGMGCNALRVSGVDEYAGGHNATHWLNAAAFATPPAVTQIGQTDYSPLGSAGQQARGPLFTNLDASVFKNFYLWRETTLQFRAEAFNAFNNAHLGQPGSLNYTNPATFAQITGLRGGAANAPRRLQFALKLNF